MAENYGRARACGMAAVVVALATLALPGTARAGGDSAADPAALDKIQVDTLRLDAQRLVERADKLDADAAQPLFESAGMLYLDTYRTYCEEPANEQRPERIDAQRCEEMAWNAARAFAAGRRTVKAVATYRMIVAADERTKRQSPLAAKAMFALGSGYQSMALYEQAADWYERFAALHPREPESVAALSDAVILRLGLGDTTAATNDARTFVKTWGRTRRTQAAQIELALALHHAEHGAKERARAMLRGVTENVDRGPIDLTIRAHALAATLAETPALARDEHAKVLAAWADPEAAERALRRSWPDESEGQVDRRLARVLNAVGAARFFVAEQRRRAEVDSLKLPVFTGTIDHVALERFADKPLRDWYVKKRAAIESVETEYLKVLEIRPLPPPASVIAAAGAVGAMWGELADDFRRVPAPAGWKKDAPLYKAYLEAVDAMAAPLREARAKPAMKKCLDLSIKYQYADDASRACATWLSSHYEREFLRVDEIIPALQDPPGPAFARSRQDPPLRRPSPPPDR